MANELQGRKVAILLAPKGTEQAEFEEPKKAVEDAGAGVDVVGIETGEVQTLVDDIDHGEKLTVENVNGFFTKPLQRCAGGCTRACATLLGRKNRIDKGRRSVVADRRPHRAGATSVREGVRDKSGTTKEERLWAYAT